MKKALLVGILILASILRLYRADTLPALNADEAALGYNAYSLLTTGKDEHGNAWPVHFQSFNDYKPGFYVYILLPFVKLLGLTVWSVRLPGIVLGIASVYMVYLLSGEIAKRAGLKEQGMYALVSAFTLAVSPWHIHFSRGAWEVNVATFFIIGGVYFFLKGVERRSLLYVSVVFFVASLYTYHSARILAPLIGLSLLVSNFRFVKSSYKSVVTLGVFAFILLIPLAFEMIGPAGVSRAAGVGLFADAGPVNRANEQRGEHGTFTGLVPKLIHNKPVNYLLAFAQNYAEHFHGEFLFLSGEEIQRNKVPETGQLHMYEFLFVGVGLISIIRRPKGMGVVVTWLLVAPLAASLTFQSPHALRAQNMVLPLSMVSGYGLYLVATIARSSRWGVLLFVLIGTTIVWGVGRYLHMYYIHMPKEYPFSSQYGVEELVSYVKTEGEKYEQVVVTDRYDQPYILFLFYLQYPPERFQQEHSLTPRDSFGFSTVRNFDKYVFISITDWDKLRETYKNSLVAGTDSEIYEGTNVVKRVYFPNGDIAYEVVAN